MVSGGAGEREVVMKKTLGKIAALALFSVVFLSGCNREKLPDSFDEAVVQEEAEKAVAFFNERDYQGIIDMGDDNLKSNSTVEKFEESCDPLLDEKGDFQEISKISIVGSVDKSTGTKYGGAIVTGSYTEGEIVFSIAFNEDMELVQFIIR